MIKLGGIFGIVSGSLALFWGIITLLIAVFAEPIGETEDMMGNALLPGIFLFLVGILGIICGICALKINKWRWAIPGYILFWDVFGVILTITLFDNLLLVYLNLLRVNKRSKLGFRLYIMGFLFLFFIITFKSIFFK